MINKLNYLKKFIKNSSDLRNLEDLIKLAGEAVGYPTTFSDNKLNPLIVQSITSLLQKTMLDSIDSIATILNINQRDFKYLNNEDIKSFIKNKAQEISHSSIKGKGDKNVSFYDLYLASKIKHEDTLSAEDKKYPKPIDVDSEGIVSTGPMRFDFPEPEVIEPAKKFDQQSSELIIKSLLNLYISQNKEQLREELFTVIDGIRKKDRLYEPRIERWSEEGEGWRADVKARGSKGYSNQPDSFSDGYRDIIKSDPITLIKSILDSMNRKKELIPELKPYINEIIFELVSKDYSNVENLEKFLEEFKNAKWAIKKREDLGGKSYIDLVEEKLNKLKTIL